MSVPVFKIHSNRRFYLVGSKVVSKQDKLTKDEYSKAIDFIRDHSSEYEIDDDVRREMLLEIDLNEIEMKDFFRIVSNIKQGFDIEGIIKKYFELNNIVLTTSEVKSFLNLC